MVDLRARVLSGIVLVAVGTGAIWLGGAWFAALAVIAAGLMFWELAAMMGCGVAAVWLGLAGGCAEAASIFSPSPWTLAALLLPPLAGAALVRRDGAVFVIYGTAVLATAHVLVGFLGEFGAIWMAWLVSVVVATDILGYFAGRLIGGPKFWPRVSPKKTWSGTVAGWIAAAGVGVIFAHLTTANADLPLVSAVVALASQMGDIAESAIKRRMGWKDSSHLIPGHGGLLDRFDGLLGATLAMLLITEVVVVPILRL